MRGYSITCCNSKSNQAICGQKGGKKKINLDMQSNTDRLGLSAFLLFFAIFQDHSDQQLWAGSRELLLSQGCKGKSGRGPQLHKSDNPGYNFVNSK